MSSFRGLAAWFPIALLLGAFSAGCETGHAATLMNAAGRATATRSDASPNGRAGRVVTFEGACDASGAVEIDARHFAVADDEDNVLRVYDADLGGPPIHTVDLSPSLPLRKTRRAESDFEAATRLGDTAYFLTSHGRTAKGKRDPDRLLLVATNLPSPGSDVAVHGQPYRSLLDDLLEHPGFRRFGIADASLRAPKEPGGLNLEGLTASPDGSLLLGFRNPVPEGRAIFVRLLNPAGVPRGERARLSDPVLVDLQGLGVRALSTWGGSFLIAAGPSIDGGPFRLFRYDGKSASAVPGVDLTGFAPEGFFTPEARDELMLLSDDGTRILQGKPCKSLKDQASKRFRGLWIRLPK